MANASMGLSVEVEQRFNSQGLNIDNEHHLLNILTVYASSQRQEALAMLEEIFGDFKFGLRLFCALLEQQ